MKPESMLNVAYECWRGPISGAPNFLTRDPTLSESFGDFVHSIVKD